MKSLVLANPDSVAKIIKRNNITPDFYYRKFLERNRIAMGAESLADIVRSASELNGLILADQAEPEKLYPLDIEFQKLMDVDRLEARRVRYTKENIEQFISA